MFRLSGDNMTLVKICGITTPEDVEYINEAKPDFAGFVMFFEKSRRNIDVQTAKKLLNMTDKSIKRVAVTVKPDITQLNSVKDCGFDYVQIHGKVPDKILINSPVPVLRAFNVSDTEKFYSYGKIDNIKGYLFDSQVPGSGKIFDWSLLDKIPRDGKMFFLAGGLTPENVAKAIKTVNPDGVDVSSGVENVFGKNRRKILEFVNNVRNL